MQHFRVGLALAIAVFSACNPGNKANNNASTDATVKPATPEGTISVVVTDKEKDTQLVTIKFQIKDLKKEKTFEQAVLKGVSETDEYKVLWDAPNSCYIGVLKPSHQARYYHASVKGNDLKILWVPTPPEQIWQYMENTMGLGKVSVGGQLADKYRKNIQSGKILGEFIAEIRPDASPDSLELYVEFGGVRKSMFMPIPKGYKPTIQETANVDHVLFSLVKDGKAEPMIDMHVENGRLQIKTLKEITKD
ncbi:hypothetical protein CLV51_103768 [Chitinophaga niastensis]|uniref:Lipoprotein n=1 Tax=Chitinophaga niastensis TaxID=536980 RepID=A0A2P8HKP7_CHINA|nr:hypothetical protein [Chitinophaga niastensis]PSL46786.1 hypothetical protein CLV51_103768 [Chitinophaga niastensis]